jgi:Protein of unknown function (DUF2867)
MNHHKAHPVALPSKGVIAAHLPGADFADAYRIVVERPERKAMAHFVCALQRTPAWVRAMMHVRNRAVALVGLRSSAAWEPRATDNDHPYAIGERVGIFELMHVDDDEVVAGDDDKHLRVLISVQREAPRDGQPAAVVMTTVVHIHNWLGHLYMMPVTPAHKVIAPTVLTRVNEPGSASTGRTQRSA